MCEKIDDEEVRIGEIEIRHLSVLEYLEWKTNVPKEEGKE